MDTPRKPSFRERYLRLGRRNLARDVDDEIGFHIERRTEELIAQGMSPARARQLALHRFGDPEAPRAECIAIAKRRERKMVRVERLSELRQDVAVVKTASGGRGQGPIHRKSAWCRRSSTMTWPPPSPSMGLSEYVARSERTENTRPFMRSRLHPRARWAERVCRQNVRRVFAP